METRLIRLSLDTAKRLYEQGGEYRDIALTAFKEHEFIGDRLPKTWQEYCIKHDEEGDKIKASLNTAYMTINKYTFSDYKQAQAHIALMKLHLLRDEYRQGWIPDWNNPKAIKICITRRLTNRYEIEPTDDFYPTFLSFKDNETAKEFLKYFKDLIKQAGDLI